MGKLKDIDGSFNGRHFDREFIVLCVRWHQRYKLSFRDITEMMAERGLSLALITIHEQEGAVERQRSSQTTPSAFIHWINKLSISL
jgi:transposase-like protein